MTESFGTGSPPQKNNHHNGCCATGEVPLPNAVPRGREHESGDAAVWYPHPHPRNFAMGWGPSPSAAPVLGVLRIP